MSNKKAQLYATKPPPVENQRWFSSTLLLLLLVGASAGGCDSVNERSFDIEVTEVSATETSFGAPSFTIQVENTGSEPLSRVEIEFTIHPQDQIKSGTSTSILAPRISTIVEVVLLQVEDHGDYDCYTSGIRAFASGETKAVIDRTGPTTCK